jgi:predicted DNA-binding protein (MmcQ/YjbR family)
MTIDDIRALCYKNKHVTEDVKWDNDLCFLIAKKMFCVASLEPPLTVAFKVLPDEFDELSVRPGIIPAPYMARNKWIKVDDLNVFSKKEWEYYIRQSYELVKSKLPKKLLKELED